MIANLTLLTVASADPYRNLAIEKYLTFHTQPDECVLYLWQNRKTVVIGRNQNCWKECNVSLLEKEGGCLARRLSGGGAVFHDMGNLNFTFCVQKENYNTARQLDVILIAARLLGIEAEKSGRNDVLADGRKFSGNAFFQSGDYCYHHGTLMVDTDPAQMQRYLQVSADKLKRNGVSSVRSRVVNLKELNPALTVEKMEEALYEAARMVYGCPLRIISEKSLDQKVIEVYEQEFASWQWKYGKKIPFTTELGGRLSWGSFDAQLQIDSGIIRDAVIYSDSMFPDLMDHIQQFWTGCRYNLPKMMEKVRRAIHEVSGTMYIPQSFEEEIRKILEEQL